MIKPDPSAAEAAVLGGSVLGGGGGGWIKDGLEVARLAIDIGEPWIVGVDEVPEDATVVTVSAVGSQAAEERFLKPIHYVRAVNLLAERADITIDGLISSENGAGGTVNGWFQSAALGIPVVDAPCNGRAHPTGVMGSMGLDSVEGFVSLQAAVGGNPKTGNYVEVFVEASLPNAASIVRYASSSAGGVVAVARNPIDVGYVKANGAPGAIRQAMEVGMALQENRGRGPRSMIDSVLDVLHGTVVMEGKVEEAALETTGGFDVGGVKIVGDSHRRCELTFWNEYMTLESEGVRVATFPDLISTMSLESGLPLISGEIAQGQRVAVISTAKENLRLGAGMRDPRLFRQVEAVIKKPIVEYAFKKEEP